MSQPNQPASVFSTNTMIGNWAQKAYHISWDGNTILSHRFGGFAIVNRAGGAPRDFNVLFTYRNMFWGPDNKKFIVWTNQGIAIGDTGTIGNDCNKPNLKVIYKFPVPGRQPFGAGWSPSGSDVYILEHYQEEVAPGKTQSGSAIQRVPAGGGPATEILHHPTKVLWFNPPVQRFEDGSGPSNRPYSIVFGAQDGVWIMDRNGGSKEKLSDLKPDGVFDMIWSPHEKQEKFALYLTQAQPSPGKVWKGVYIFHLDRKKKVKDDSWIEQVQSTLDTHTMWFSGSGKYFTWANDKTVFFREADATPDKTVQVSITDKPGLTIKGCGWDPKEDRLAIAAGNRLYMYDVAKKTLTFMQKFGEDDGKTFIADPVFHGNEIIFGAFTDTSQKAPVLPGKPGDKPKDSKK